MKTYYEKVKAQEEFDYNNNGLEYGIYWYEDLNGNNFLDAQWFKTEQERTDFITENQMLPLKS
jgi:hypothetical protein